MFFTCNCFFLSQSWSTVKKMDVINITSLNKTRMMGKFPDVQFGIWFSTWNVEPMSGKQGKISDTLKRHCVDICCVQEVRWKG